MNKTYECSDLILPLRTLYNVSGANIEIVLSQSLTCHNTDNNIDSTFSSFHDLNGSGSKRHAQVYSQKLDISCEISKNLGLRLSK